MTAEEEKKLIKRIQRGSETAFEELVRSYEAVIYTAAKRMLGSPEDAEEATQDTFLRAYRAMGTFRADAKLSTWLGRICTNVCIDMLRKRREETVSLSDEEGNSLDIPDVRSLPEEEAERRELRDAVQRGIDELPREQQRLIVLRELDGLSYEEISRKLGLELGTVKSGIFRARKKLCRILTENGNISPGAASNKPEGGGRK